MVLANARSIKGKSTELQILSCQYYILCLTETHIDSTFVNNEILFSSDKALYRRDRNVHGGGVLIAIAPSVSHQFVHVEMHVLPVEAVCISVDLRPRLDCELTIVCLYIPPNT